MAPQDKRNFSNQNEGTKSVPQDKNARTPQQGNREDVKKGDQQRQGKNPQHSSSQDYNREGHNPKNPNQR